MRHQTRGGALDNAGDNPDYKNNVERSTTLTKNNNQPGGRRRWLIGLSCQDSSSERKMSG